MLQEPDERLGSRKWNCSYEIHLRGKSAHSAHALKMINWRIIHLWHRVKYGVRSQKFIWAPCAQLYSLACRDPTTPLLSPHLGSYTRALLVNSQDRRRLFVTPCFYVFLPPTPHLGVLYYIRVRYCLFSQNIRHLFVTAWPMAKENL